MITQTNMELSSNISLPQENLKWGQPKLFLVFGREEAKPLILLGLFYFCGGNKKTNFEIKKLHFIG